MRGIQESSEEQGYKGDKVGLLGLGGRRRWYKNGNEPAERTSSAEDLFKTGSERPGVGSSVRPRLRSDKLPSSVDSDVLRVDELVLDEISDGGGDAKQNMVQNVRQLIVRRERTEARRDSLIRNGSDSRKSGVGEQVVAKVLCKGIGHARLDNRRRNCVHANTAGTKEISEGLGDTCNGSLGLQNRRVFASVQVSHGK